eukprot:11175735-Lingulodinium_polyedra.AAC.1
MGQRGCKHRLGKHARGQINEVNPLASCGCPEKARAAAKCWLSKTTRLTLLDGLASFWRTKLR